MLKEIFSQRLNTQSKTVNNAIITLGDIDDSGKGRKFKSRFLTPGVAGYPGQFGNVLIKKETFDKFINTMVGVPVIINHKDITAENANNERVGVVSNAWFDDKDGWYWCDGVIWDETAQNLITDKGWSVSCSYDVKLADDTGGSENNIPYDIEFLDGVFTHLAIVNNPRYERANIVLNSKTVVQNFNPNHDAEGKFCSGSNVNYTSYGDGESAHVIPVEYLNEGKHAKQYGGLPIDEYYKKTGQYRKLREKLSPTPQDNKTMQEIAGYILEDELYNLTHTKYNNDSLKNVQIDMIKGIKKSIKELEEWFDLSKHKKKHMSKSWLDYLEKHPEEFKNNTVVTNATEDAQGNLHSESNGQFVSKGGVNPNYKEELKQVIDKAKNNPTEHQKLVIGTVSKDLEEKAKENGFDIAGYQHDLDVSGTRHAIKEHGQPKTEEPQGQIAITDGDFEKIPEVIYGYDDVSFTGKNKIGRETITYKKSFDDGTIMYVEEIRDKRKTLTINTMYKYKNTGNPRTFVDNNNPLSNASIYIITDIQKDFNPDIKNNVQNNKEQDMALLDELKKLITKVENDKGEDMDDDKEKVENEKVDKRDIIRQIMAIAGKREDDEDVRTIAKLAEKLAYDKSEAGTADNKKVKNEETEEDKKEYEDLKKDVKEDVENKCKNSVDNAKGGYFDKMNEIYNSANEPKEENLYISREQKLKNAEEYFAK